MAMASSLYKAQEVVKTCDEHEHKELSFFCKTCKTFICISCGKTTHLSHDWDLIASIAKERRIETPKLCQKIKNEELSQCREKLCNIVKSMKSNREADIAKLEESKSAIINTVKLITEEVKEQREELARNETVVESRCHDLETKMDYVEKMTTCLDSNIAAYNDFDLLEMEMGMLTALQDVKSYVMKPCESMLKFVPGKMNKELIREMVGTLEKTYPNDNGNVSVAELKTFSECEEYIRTIAVISDTQAWVGDGVLEEIKLFSSQMTNIERKHMEFDDFIVLGNGDFILTVYRDQVIRRVKPGGTESNIMKTKPLQPTWISKTHKDDILVSMTDDGDDYKLRSSSRRLVQRITLGGKVLNTYEFQKDDATRLFTYPWRTAENGNSDICAINRTSDDTGELIVLHGDGRARATYCGQKESKFDPRDVACDCNRKIIVLDCVNKSLHLLSSDGTFLTYLLSNMPDYAETMALYQGSMWVGFNKGEVKVYNYCE